MRKSVVYTLFAIFTLYSYTFTAQFLSYEDLAIQFSKEDYKGSARFNSMSGSFGALGGELSALYINPAGGSVFNSSEFSTSLSTQTFDTQANYYNTKSSSTNTKFRFPQFGIVLVFKDKSKYLVSDWHKFAIAFNYAITNDFTNTYTIKGNHNTPPNTHSMQDDPDTEFTIPNNQTFTNQIKGNNSIYSFSFSSVYQKILHIGASINFHDITFSQNTHLSEENFDGVETFETTNYTDYINEVGDGISLGFGIIGKPLKNLRIGLAYQSPTWYYDIKEETYDNILEYNITNPDKLTASIAYIFNKFGLINIDYSFSNYKNLKLGGNQDFTSENNFLESSLNDSARTLKIGTEWRLKDWSFRGGYFHKDSPFSNLDTKYDTKGYSAGIGINVRNTRFDISYEKYSLEDIYDFYGRFESISPTRLNIDSSKITATFALSF